MATFADLGVPAELVPVLTKRGIIDQFPIQTAVIPSRPQRSWSEACRQAYVQRLGRSIKAFIEHPDTGRHLAGASQTFGGGPNAIGYPQVQMGWVTGESASECERRCDPRDGFRQQTRHRARRDVIIAIPRLVNSQR